MRTNNHYSRAFFTLLPATVLLLSLAGAVISVEAQIPTVVHAFNGVPGPVSPIVEAIPQGRDGNLYLTAGGGSGGAADCTTTYCGEAFSVTPSGTVTDVFDFSNNNCGVINCGNTPYGGLTLGTDGNFYGAFYYGGTAGNNGEVFQLTPAGVLTALYNFTGGSDGSHPNGAPIQGTNGTFYGTTSSGGTGNSAAYSVTSSGVFNTLHTFTGTDGQNIDAPLVQGTDGDFYGCTVAGGTSNNGVIFKMTATGAVTVLHNLSGTDGSNCSFALIQASDGNFYGSAYSGGTTGAGVVFKITSNGTYTVIHNLNGTTDGNGPWGTLVQATDGKMYGVTSNPCNSPSLGTIYSITTTGTFATLYSFTGGTDGGVPFSPLRQHTDGLLYGTTYIGGDTADCSSNVCNAIFFGCGEVYSLDVGLRPFVSLVSTSGKEGARIGILGQGFSASSVVKFGGTTATAITLSGTTFINATVPAGALTGSVTVTTGATTLTSNSKFRVTPTLASFSPTSGPVGTPVMVTGTGLLQTTKVTFNHVAATTVTINSDTQVTANVPTGATTGKISITTRGGTGTSMTVFTVN